ncbi:putative mucin-2 [Apostichopus japonicus]|uniref:Putative mucin-2 n=1 Tax=Stichopus japonicus TaxID=307972 RepID=A0A2G8K5Y1_STIJA|nr:putative mucin-2 [Apostichopus japonicus]
MTKYFKIFCLALSASECYGYGDPHYFDFAGQHFDNQGVGTYILSRDLSQNPPLYMVLIDNIPCEAFPTTSCPQQLIVETMGHTIQLFGNLTDIFRPQAAIDGQLVTPPYQDDDFTIFANGIFMVLVVPDIGLEVRFLPQGYNYFRVVVPSAVYYNNTDGLCAAAKSTCTQMTPKSVKGHGAPPCVPTHEQSHWCENLFLPIFEPCWDKVDPCDFFDTCSTDICVSNQTESCWSLEAYAMECTFHGICLEWRNDTFCHEECPEGKEFRECVCPDNLDGDATCYEDWYHGGKENCDLDPVEGCFCPPGTREDENGECVPCFTTPVPSTTGTKVTSEVTSTGPPETTTSGPSSTVTTGASTTGPTTIEVML